MGPSTVLRFIPGIFVVMLFSLVTASKPAFAKQPNVADRLTTEVLSRQEDRNWLAHGNTYHEQRYSTLEQINDQNVAELGLSWSFDTDFRRGLEATPIVVDGVMFVVGNWNVVYALNAVSGELLWKYDPQVPREWAKMACCDVVSRGVAVFEGKVFFATLDARMIALDAGTGQKLWETQAADTSEHPYTITGAPRVFKDKVVIGNSGGEYGVRGFVSAFDINSGEEVWRFYTVPGNPDNGFESPAMEMAAKTWTGEWWNYGGGGTVWDAIVYDPDLDQLYIGVGNGSPWNQLIRSPEGGDNLFLSSIVALNPDTGEYLWHYQETPGETWDFTATQHIMLADMEWQGEARKVIWHAPKNGFFFIIDRENGKLLSAEPFAEVNWASHYDLETGRPVETDFARYRDKPETIRPASFGAHNWHPMAHSPKTGYVYIPANDMAILYETVQNYRHNTGHWNTGINIAQPNVDSLILRQQLVEKLVKGSLVAWDPDTQQAAWTVPHPQVGNSGVVATAGNLVFQGTATGQFVAFSADKGEQLWSFDAKTAVMGSPVTFSVDGEQYVTVLAGRGGVFGLLTGVEVITSPPPSRVLTFKLGATQTLPENPPLPEYDVPPPLEGITPDELAQGRQLYHEFCSACHGPDVISGRGIPDLRQLPPVFYDNFDAIVLDGMMAKAGMVGFSDVLGKDEADMIKAYILHEAAKLKELNETPEWLLKIKTWFYSIVASLIALIR